MDVRKEDALEQDISVDAASVVDFFKQNQICAAG